MTDRQFSGKVAIVTGAASGIGRAIASRLAELGSAVIIADRNAVSGAAAADHIRKEGGRVNFVEMDLGRPEDAGRTVQTATDTFGRLDILINCAATVGVQKPITDLTLLDWEAVIRTNLTGTFLLTQAAVRRMLAQQQGGAIVNILAIQADLPLPDHAPYAASKGALCSFTRALAVELTEQGIRVNGIAVGPVYTESARDALAAEPGDGEQAVSKVPEDVDRSAATLLGRMGRPEEIAQLAVFLASEDASYLVGAIIPADGGRSLSRKPDPFLLAQRGGEPRKSGKSNDGD